MLSYIGALVHDLGNPPFGHFGEDSICSWFETEIGRKALSPLKNHPELDADLSVFEGNARTTRLLASLQVLADNNGLNLTAATMSVSMKYVASSLEANPEGDDHGRIKPGYCQTEKAIVEKIREVTGTGNARHPLAFIIEAADDTVYSICDIEDGIRKRAISWSVLKQELKKELEDKVEGDELAKLLKKSEEDIKKIASDSGLKLGYGMDEAASIQFRILAQRLAIEAAKTEFANHYRDIMDGSFKGELLSDKCEHLGAKIVKACKKVGGKKVYGIRGNLELELSGMKIIHDLLSLLWKGISSFDGEAPKGKTYEGKVYGLISRNYRCLFEYDWKKGSPVSAIPNDVWRHYLKLMLITDYVAGMIALLMDTDACLSRFDLDRWPRATESWLIDNGWLVSAAPAGIGSATPNSPFRSKSNTSRNPSCIANLFLARN